MLYKDRIYGEFEITDPVILELINSSALQRLRDIDQHGYFEPHFPGSGYSRFEHSLGVFLILRNYGAKPSEQIAGLIHDASHAVFSHCTDYVLGTDPQKVQTHQDDIFEKFIHDSEIPGIIKKYNLDLNYLLDENHFPLKEKSLPDLCADRIDYSLREGFLHKEINQNDIDSFLNNLTVVNNNWIFKDLITAKKYAELFLKMNRNYWAGLPSAIMFQTVADCLRYCLQKEYLSEQDLYSTDQMVIGKITEFSNNDEELNVLWQRMNNEIRANNNPNNYDAKVLCKSRIVDPLFQDNNTIKRLSEAEPGWIDILEQELKPKQYFLKFEE